jgi:nucleotide-binding universal stress UspA family protein
MYKKMLVPLDASDFAECVFDHAQEIASARAIPEVVLFTVVEPVRPVVYSYFGDEGARSAEAVALESAEVYLDAVKARLGLDKSNVTTVVASGEPSEQILEYVKDNGVDLVVMSTHGRSGVSKWFMGSVAERVVRGSTAPVFLVPTVECRARESH